jgi:hypothetical protein
VFEGTAVCARADSYRYHVLPCNDESLDRRMLFCEELVAVYWTPACNMMPSLVNVTSEKTPVTSNDVLLLCK